MKNVIKKKTLKKKYKNIHGGQVIESGGFGCLMKPAIKCKNETKRKKNSVTKIMIKKYAQQEYEVIQKITSILSKIKNYKKYFFLENIKLCIPDKFTKSDLSNFDSKCKPLLKKNITSENINSSENSDKILALSMPDGGIDVGNYIIKYNNFQYLKVLNAYLLKLLLNGIIEMNKLGVYHFDIKESNILIKINNKPSSSSSLSVSLSKKNKKKVLVTRIIDWGLSFVYTNKTNSNNNFNLNNLPNNMINRPFQYNLPFSTVLFNDVFLDYYKKFLNKNPNPTYENITIFLEGFLLYYLKNYETGHYSTIERIFENIEKYYSLKKNDTTINIFKISLLHSNQSDYSKKNVNFYIINYLGNILHYYTSNGVMDMTSYLKVFLSNVDIYGFILTYYPIFELLINNYENLKTTTEMKLLNTLSEFILISIENPQYKIVISKIVDKIKEIELLYNDLIKYQEKNPIYYITSTKSSILEDISL